MKNEDYTVEAFYEEGRQTRIIVFFRGKPRTVDLGQASMLNGWHKRMQMQGRRVVIMRDPHAPVVGANYVETCAQRISEQLSASQP